MLGFTTIFFSRSNKRQLEFCRGLEQSNPCIFPTFFQIMLYTHYFAPETLSTICCTLSLSLGGPIEKENTQRPGLDHNVLLGRSPNECSVPLLAISSASEVFQYLREVFFFLERWLCSLGSELLCRPKVTLRPTTEVANIKTRSGFTGVSGLKLYSEWL